MPSSFHYSLVVLVSVIIAVAAEKDTRCTRRRSRARRARRGVAPRATVTEMPPPPPPPRSRFGTTAAPASGGVGIDGVCRSCNTTENSAVRAYYVALKKLRRKSVARVAVAAPSGEFSVCLVTQCSEERHAMFGQLLERWGGPASAAVWVTTDDGEASVRKSAAAFLAGAPPPLRLQILRGRPLDPYPVNRLRNLAVAAVTASHFFVCDVDLRPSEGAPRRFTRAAAQLHDAVEARDGRPRVRGVLVGVPPARRRRRAADARRAQALRAPAVGQLVALRRVQTLDGDAHVDLVPAVVEDRRRRRPVQGAVLRLDPLRAVRPRAEGRRDARL